MMPPELVRRVEQVAENKRSGAAALLDEAVGILRDALAMKAPVAEVGAALCRAQPSMAPMWNAALEAVAAVHDVDRFERFAQRVQRAPAAVASVGARHFLGDGETTPCRVLTVSNSRSVMGVLEAVHRRRPVHLSCSDSRPALEGRALAAACAERGMTVTLYGDAAIGHAVASADAMLVGADAVSPSWFINKSGTRMLAAAASLHGLPVYVVASRDKFLPEAVAARLSLREGAAADIWDAPPPGVTVRNPYFEATPLDLVSAVIADVGVLGVDMVADVCRSLHDERTLRALEQIGGP